MRIPWFIVVISALVVVAGVWSFRTRGMDFLTPPGEAEIAEIRQRVESTLPQPDRPYDAVSVPDGPPADVEVVDEGPVKPVIQLGDLSSAPALGAYKEVAGKGAEYLAELAAILETEGEFQRALLAWERILDHAGGGNEEIVQAVAAVKRLRESAPVWNVDPEGAIEVVLHAEVAKPKAEELGVALEGVAKLIGKASSGILSVTPMVTANPRSAAVEGPAPVVVRLSGAGDAGASTEVLSFRNDDPDALPQFLAATVFQLMRNYLGRSEGMVAPADLGEGESALEALEFRVTRLAWRELGAALNETAVPDEE